LGVGRREVGGGGRGGGGGGGEGGLVRCCGGEGGLGDISNSIVDKGLGNTLRR